MSRDDDDALAGDARGLLAAYRAEEGLPAEVRARVWSRVDRSLHAEAAVVPTSGASHLRWAALGLAVAAAGAAIWWGGARLSSTPGAAASEAPYRRDDARDGPHELEAKEPGRATVVGASTPAPRPAELPPASPPTQPSTPAAATTASPMQPDASASSRAQPTRSAARAAASAETSGLADETELLRAAQSALARGDADHALALLDAGKRRFGAGVLAEERAAVQVFALCELGKRTRARREADAFAAAHPGSPLLSRVRSACAEESAAPP